MDLQQLATGGPTVPMGLFGAVICTAGIIQGGHQLFQFRGSLWADRKGELQRIQFRAKVMPEIHVRYQRDAPAFPNGVFAHMVELAAVDQDQILVLHGVALPVYSGTKTTLEKKADLHIGVPVRRQMGVFILVEKDFPGNAGIIQFFTQE